MKPYQLLPLRVRVDLRVMAKKEYSTHSRTRTLPLDILVLYLEHPPFLCMF